MQALRQQINELQIDKDLKHDLLAAINDKQRYGLVWEESSEEAWDEMQAKLPVFVEDATKRLDSAPEGSPNHLLIEGDNLNALTGLAYTHAGKIDVIYIDPPYFSGINEQIEIIESKIVDSNKQLEANVKYLKKITDLYLKNQNVSPWKIDD